ALVAAERQEKGEGEYSSLGPAHLEPPNPFELSIPAVNARNGGSRSPRVESLEVQLEAFSGPRASPSGCDEQAHYLANADVPDRRGPAGREFNAIRAGSPRRLGGEDRVGVGRRTGSNQYGRAVQGGLRSGGNASWGTSLHFRSRGETASTGS